MSSGFASNTTNVSSTNGAIACSTLTIKNTTAHVKTTTNTPPFELPHEAPSKIDKLSLSSAISRIDTFVQMLLFPKQHSILQDYAVRYIELFSVYYCDSKSLLRLKGNADTISNNCKITVPFQPVQGIQEVQVYKDLAKEVASFSTVISHHIKRFCDQVSIAQQ